MSALSSPHDAAHRDRIVGLISFTRQRPSAMKTDRIGGRCFLSAFRPLVGSASGRQALERHGLPPFIDSSCRREPDLESRFPSITAMCRAGHFAPRLEVGDHVAYLTVKGRYFDLIEPHWRLVAVLRVIRRFGSHSEAAAWYADQGSPLPSNCFVEGNSAQAFDRTNGHPPAEVKARLGVNDGPDRVVRLWDAGYRGRVTQWPVFIATEPEFLELHRPPAVQVHDLVATLGKVPGLQNPPAISCDRLAALIQLATARTESRLRNASG